MIQAAIDLYADGITTHPDPVRLVTFDRCAGCENLNLCFESGDMHTHA